MKREKNLFLFLLIWTISGLHSQGQAYHGSAAHDYIEIYQKYLSSLKLSHCPMYPTCSQYGKMVFADHNFPIAMILTADRMIRCGGHLEYYPTIETGIHQGRKLDYPPSRSVPIFLTAKKSHAVAAETIIATDSIEKVIQFTNRLINQHNYAIALLEIEWLLYYDTIFQNKEVLYLNKLRCLEGMQRYSDGVLFYEQQMPYTMKESYKILYTTAHLYDLIGDYNLSLNLFKKSALICDNNDVNPYGELAILYTRMAMFDEAKMSLMQKYAIDGNEKTFASSISILNKLVSTKHKSPTMAMLLGVIPGAGYLYTKQPRNALTSLLVNGVLAYAVYTSVKSENYGLSIILGAFTISFYGGNIVGSGSSARRYNEKMKHDALVELRNNNPFLY